MAKNKDKMLERFQRKTDQWLIPGMVKEPVEFNRKEYRLDWGDIKIVRKPVISFDEYDELFSGNAAVSAGRQTGKTETVRRHMEEISRILERRIEDEMLVSLTTNTVFEEPALEYGGDW